MRRFLIALAAAVGSLFLFAAPAVAAGAQQPWEPVKEAPESRIYIEPSVDEDTRNAIQSAFESALEGEEATRYVYVAKVPETWDVQSATRKVAEVWGLDRTKDSILFYDSQGRSTFAWPAVEKNVESVKGLPKIVETADFTENFDALYQADTISEDGEADDGSPVFLYAFLIVVGCVVVVFFLMLVVDFY